METHSQARRASGRLIPCDRRIAVAAVLSCCLSIQVVASAATQYVGPAATGNGSGGDHNNLKSMGAAMTSARPGDLFLLQPGSYGKITFANTGYGSAAGGYVTYRADPNTCAARASNWFMDSLSRPSSVTSPIFSLIVFDQDYYAATGKAKPKRIEIDGLCVVGWGIGLYNHVAYVKISNCSVWGQIPDDPVYHFASQRANGIISAPAAHNGGNDFNNISVDACYVDFCADGIDMQGNRSGDITVSNCHVRDVAGSPLSARPWASSGVTSVIGNHLEHEVVLPWPTNNQTGYTVAAANAGDPSRSFSYQGAAPPSGTNRFWVKVDDVSQGISQLRPIASMTDTSVTLGAVLSFAVQPGDTIAFYGVMHGSGIAIWGSNVTVRGNYVHDCGTTSGIFLYQKALQNITIENNLVYDIINQYTVMLGEPGNRYSYGNNFRLVNNTFVGRQRPEYQTSPDRTYGFALYLQADGATDLSTVTICNNLLVGASWPPPVGAAVRGNILYAGGGYSEGTAGTNQGNRVYYHGQAYPNQPHPFDGSGKYFVGGSGFDTYAFGPSQHGQNLNGGDFMPVAGSNPVGFAYADRATATDITGKARGVKPDTGCYQAVVSFGPVLSAIGDQQVTTGQLLTLTVNATGSSSSLTYSASGLPAGATFSGQTFTWTPSVTQTGTYQVPFTVDDGKYRDSKTVTITVTKENSAPILGAIGNKSVNENQALTFALDAVDADGDAITYSAANLPAGATLIGQTFSWTPTYDQAGSYNMTLTASDGQAQNSRTIAIAVANIDRPPVLADIDAKSVNLGSPLNFALSATDPDGDRLTYSAATLPSGATLTGQTFTWTPASGQGGSYPVTFTVSDGALTDSGTVTIRVASAAQDQTAPVVAQCSPAPGAIQVALNNLVTLQITDADSGVDVGSVVIQVNDNVVYQGNAGVYSSAYGRCSRSGTENDYRFIYQSDVPFDFDQVVAVSVAAADRAGNAMSEYQGSFTTEMRAFGRNQTVSSLGEYADSKPVTASDPAGNIWVAWHAGTGDRRDIYVAKQPAGSSAFQTPIRLTSDVGDQCNPALAVNAAGAVSVVWQDNRSGDWDIYTSVSWDGRSFSKEARVTGSNRNETSPAVAFDHQTPGGVYVAWQDDRNGNQDIYLASSTNGFATSTESRITSNPANQTEPDLAIDAGNIVYVFWTDRRSGPADIYAAASNAGPWTNMPIVTGAGDQTQPAVANGSGDALHLLWVDNASGNSDIFYASLNGLPDHPVAGVDIIDDTSGADQTAPAIVCGADQKVFASWQDCRHAGSKGTDTDLYVAELRSAAPRANVFVGDDGTNVRQSDPALGVDYYGQPYVVWTDSRQATTEIYCATTTLVDPTPLDSKTVVASAGACLGTDPAAIRKIQDVSLVVPPGACQADLRMTISKILGSQVSATALLGSYEFGPSGVDFEQPVTVTIPYAVGGSGGRALPYWYDSVTGAMSQQGITDIQNVSISSGLNALRFRTTHFTPFYLIAADSQDAAPAGGAGGGGGCALSKTGGGSPGQLLVPYAAIALIMMILRRRDRRRALQTRLVARDDSSPRLAQRMV